MAQQRFFNWKENDSTFLLSQRLTGLQPKGRYAGYDFTPTANMTLTLGHGVSGSETREYSGLVKQVGVSMTNQGVIVFEDEPVTLPINTTAAEPRIDIVIMTHSQTQNVGGAAALYSIIQGTPAETPVKPSVPNPDTQIEIGSLYLPANITALDQAGVAWTQSQVSAFETKVDTLVYESAITSLNSLSSNIIEAFGRAMSAQDTANPTGLEPALPPILLCGGTNEALNVVGGFLYLDGELLILEDGYNFDSGSGDVVFDIIGTAPFRIARPRLSPVADGDFSGSDLKLLYDFLLESLEGVWIDLSTANGWIANSAETINFNKFQIKRQGNRRELRGCIYLDGGSLPSSNVVYNLSPISRPIKENRFPIRHTTGIGSSNFPEEFMAAEAYVKPNGDIEIKYPYSPAGTSYYWLDGIRWYID